jgi:hypothetical protein
MGKNVARREEVVNISSSEHQKGRLARRKRRLDGNIQLDLQKSVCGVVE